MNTVLLPLLLIVISVATLRAQFSHDGDVRYDTLREDPFPGYEKASFVVNWYHDEGISWGQRYHYEIIVIDTLLVTNFYSKGGGDETYHHVAYLRKRILESSELQHLKTKIKSARIKQHRIGIPRPTFSCSGFDVLILRMNSKQIAGGRIFSECDEDTIPQYDAETLTGAFDTVTGALLSLFPMFDTLHSIVTNGKSLPLTVNDKPLPVFRNVDDLVYHLVDTEFQNNLWNLDTMAAIDSPLVSRALQRLNVENGKNQEFYFLVITYAMEELLPALPSTISLELIAFVRSHPSEFLSYFASEPSLQFGQLDDWASLLSNELQGKTKAEYDRNELALEQIIARAVAQDSLLKPTANVFIDRLRDIKHNDEEHMKE